MIAAQAQTAPSERDALRRREPLLFDTPFAPDLSLEEASAEMATDSPDDEIDGKDFIARFITRLSAREERVIRLRFGLGGIGEHSLEEVGELVGVGRQRISQIEQKALRRLRWYARRTFPSRIVQEGAYGPRFKNISPKHHLDEPALAPLVKRKRKARKALRVARTRQTASRLQSANAAAGRPQSWQRIPERHSLRLTALRWITSAIVAALSIFAWWQTLGAPGKAFYTAQFGPSDGPWIRLLVWFLSFATAALLVPLTAYLWSEWLQDRHQRLHKKAVNG